MSTPPRFPSSAYNNSLLRIMEETLFPASLLLGDPESSGAFDQMNAMPGLFDGLAQKNGADLNQASPKTLDFLKAALIIAKRQNSFALSQDIETALDTRCLAAQLAGLTAAKSGIILKQKPDDANYAALAKDSMDAFKGIVSDIGQIPAAMLRPDADKSPEDLAFEARHKGNVSYGRLYATFMTLIELQGHGVGAAFVQSLLQVQLYGLADLGGDAQVFSGITTTMAKKAEPYPEVSKFIHASTRMYLSDLFAHNPPLAVETSLWLGVQNPDAAEVFVQSLLALRQKLVPVYDPSNLAPFCNELIEQRRALDSTIIDYLERRGDNSALYRTGSAAILVAAIKQRDKGCERFDVASRQILESGCFKPAATRNARTLLCGTEAPDEGFIRPTPIPDGKVYGIWPN